MRRQLRRGTPSLASCSDRSVLASNCSASCEIYKYMTCCLDTHNAHGTSPARHGGPRCKGMLHFSLTWPSAISLPKYYFSLFQHSAAVAAPAEARRLQRAAAFHLFFANLIRASCISVPPHTPLINICSAPPQRRNGAERNWLILAGSGTARTAKPRRPLGALCVGADL